MFAVIDCGTTNTRVYLVDKYNQVVGVGTRKVGVRNTSITGSKDELRQGICDAVAEAVKNAGMTLKDIEFMIASGMITSEIGLIEIPHIIAPAGLDELAGNVKFAGPGLLPLDIPIIFIRGIRNNYGENATLRDIRNVDFMRGEETQVVGCIEHFEITEPTNIVVLSSHTKLIHVDKRKITASLTTLSGQLYEAILKETSIGKSLTEDNNEKSGGYSFEEVVSIAEEIVHEIGLTRCFLIPRFMQVLLTTDYKERNLFIDAAIAAEEMKCFSEFENQGYFADNFIFLGHESRFKIYSFLLKKKYGGKVKISSILDTNEISELTVKGAITIANRYQQLTKR